MSKTGRGRGAEVTAASRLIGASNLVGVEGSLWRVLSMCGRKGSRS